MNSLEKTKEKDSDDEDEGESLEHSLDEAGVFDH